MKLVPVEPPTRRPSWRLTWRSAARLSAAGTFTIASTLVGMKLGSTRGRPMPSTREPPLQVRPRQSGSPATAAL
ncbi:hypothetical protein G6F40_017802 [Rhizopus arrhizus]|nr:hypothetical protein G6F40_017802 [Rhizopus arrhizus]